MPIREYQAVDPESGCELCLHGFEVLEGLAEGPRSACPQCGAPIRRLVSRAAIHSRSAVDYDQAARQGFSTFKKAGKGTWEKIAGTGVDAIVPPTAPPPRPVIDLDGN
ncbi:MAG: zinc ribbon domain-containing protein [Fimbriimonadaceae bacterium]|nr:zinc ribbon domain-containing protein [Fimbriimonadaceae bacterium]